MWLLGQKKSNFNRKIDKMPALFKIKFFLNVLSYDCSETMGFGNEKYLQKIAEKEMSSFWYYISSSIRLVRPVIVFVL